MSTDLTWKLEIIALKSRVRVLEEALRETVKLLKCYQLPIYLPSEMKRWEATLAPPAGTPQEKP